MRTQCSVKGSGSLATAVLCIFACSQPGQAGEFKFPVGLAYTSGAQNVMDELKANYPVTSDFVWPVGLAFNPYYELDFGLSFGLSLGPSSFVVVEESTPSSTDTKLNYIVPVGGFVRYTLFRESVVSPYARAGIAYNFAGGDYIGGGDVGVFGAVGVELWRTKAVGLGLELGYSTSTVTVKAGPLGSDRSADYGELTINVMAVF